MPKTEAPNKQVEPRLRPWAEPQLPTSVLYLWELGGP